VCGRVRAAGVRAPGKMLLSGGVSGVMSCAGLVSIGQYRTTYARYCTIDSSKCVATGVGEQCLTAASTNAAQFPRYPSISILNASPSRIRVVFPRYLRRPRL